MRSSPSTYSAWLRVASPSGEKFGSPAELHDARRDLVRVRLLLVRVLEELLRDALGVEPARHEVVPLVAQHADELGRERLVQELEHGLAVGAVARR